MMRQSLFLYLLLSAAANAAPSVSSQCEALKLNCESYNVKKDDTLSNIAMGQKNKQGYKSGLTTLAAILYVNPEFCNAEKKLLLSTNDKVNIPDLTKLDCKPTNFESPCDDISCKIKAIDESATPVTSHNASFISTLLPASEEYLPNEKKIEASKYSEHWLLLCLLLGLIFSSFFPVKMFKKE